jgi:hypothetical protein
MNSRRRIAAPCKDYAKVSLRVLHLAIDFPRHKSAAPISVVGQRPPFLGASTYVRFTPKSGHSQVTVRCPLSAKSGHCSGLIDYFIGAAEQRRWYGEAEHSGGLRVDHQLELVRFDNWQLRRLGALQDAANIATGLTKRIYNVGSVAYQSFDFHKVTQPIDGGESMKRRQLKTNWTLRPFKNVLVPAKTASGRSRSIASKAASISPRVSAL